MRVQGELGKAKEDQESEDEGFKEGKRGTSPSGYAREIQRPRSALHSGDFREGSPDLCQEPQSLSITANDRHNDPSSPPAHWYDFGRIHEKSHSIYYQTSPVNRSSAFGNRSRTSSLNSFSSSYVLKAPTSPLVYQANNPDLDFSPRTGASGQETVTSKADRRRTLPPGTFGSHAHPSDAITGRSLYKEETFQIASYQSQKSVKSPFTLQPASSPHNVKRQRLRGQTFSVDGPTLQHGLYAPMVGSYEESILRGRMSTQPSKPLKFTAQIGVLGRGNCKSNLKCPPHVTITFPAVFYSYSTSGTRRCISDDTPSPYVGFIDLENSLPPENRSRRKPSKRQHTSPRKCPCPHIEPRDIPSEQSSLAQQERRAQEKRSRRPQSAQSPSGGCYRIPQQGQIQIVIKNPNKTAVKLFLIPYDLEGMEPGTKTFIRQRSYSVGPVIEPDEPKEQSGADDKPILRYLAHLNICCTAKGRFFLHSGIRVVFANRVPDGKERLRNETQYPEPRYSPYKPSARSNGRKGGADLSLQTQIAGLEQTVPPPQPFLHLVPTEQHLGSLPPNPQIPNSQTLSGQRVQAEELFAIPNPSLRDISSPCGTHCQQQTRTLPLLGAVTDGPMSSSLHNTYEIGQKYSPFSRVPSRGNEAGESLIAIKLRNLDVMKRELEKGLDKRIWPDDSHQDK